MTKTPASINPNLLRWARERLGLSVEKAAAQLAVKPDRLAAWEAGTDQPSTKKLYGIAAKYDQPPAIFFLSETPQDEPLPHDFRQGGDAPHEVDYRLVKEIRNAQRLQVEARDLLEDLGSGRTEFPVARRPDERPEQLATRLRVALGIDLDTQRGWRHVSTARRAWTDAIERVGILVFSAERIPVSRFRGASIADALLPVILLNGQDSEAGRIFTLMHELGHIALRNAGICNPFEIPTQTADRDVEVERYCNGVAAAVLMPRANILEEPEVSRATASTEWPDNVLSELARRYAVSREAMLVRLLELGKTSREFYESKRADFQREYEAFEREKKTRKVIVPYKYRVLNKIGRAYTRLVLNALYEDVITTADVASLTGVNLKHMRDLEEELFGRTIAFGHGA